MFSGRDLEDEEHFTAFLHSMPVGPITQVFSLISTTFVSLRNMRHINGVEVRKKRGFRIILAIS